MAQNTTPASTPVNTVALLIDLLKVATRVGAPMIDVVADPENLSKTELRIVLALGGEGQLAGHDLAHFMALQPMTVSRALSALEDMQLVEQVDNADNRRRKPFTLTDAGRAKFAALTHRMEQVSAFVFGTLSAKEQAMIGPLLQKLDAHLIEWETPEGVTHVARR